MLQRFELIIIKKKLLEILYWLKDIKINVWVSMKYYEYTYSYFLEWLLAKLQLKRQWKNIMYYAFFKQKLTYEMNCYDKNTVLDKFIISTIIPIIFFFYERQC